MTGQQAYEADLITRPTYHDGRPRRQWSELSEVAQWSWNKNPYPLPCAAVNAGSN